MDLREPLLPLLSAVCAGIVLAHFVPFSWVDILVPAFACFGLAFLSRNQARRASYYSALCGLCLISAGPRASVVPQPPHLSVADGEIAIFEGCVVNPSLASADRARFDLELSPGARTQVSLYSRSDSELPQLAYGNRIEFTGRVRPLHNFQNPGSFDAVAWFARRSVYWNASGDAASLHHLPGQCGNGFERPLFALRAAALGRLENLYSTDPYTGAMMEAILLGETGRMERLWTEDYRSTGTYHALVISGSHVAVLAAVLLFFLRLLWLPRWMALSATLVAAWLYAGVTGWQSPVVRSAAGMTLYAIARLFFREGRLLNILAGVAVLFLVVDPTQLFDPSFQLSFLAVALIAAFAVPVLDATSAPLAAGCRALGDPRRDIRLDPRTAQFRLELRLLTTTLRMVARVPTWLGDTIVLTCARLWLYLYEIVVTSFFIQIGLALPMVWYFHRLSFSGLSANVMVLPALTAVVPLGFVAIGLQSASLAGICGALLRLSRWATVLNARWEPDWRIPAPPLWLACFFALFLCVAAWRDLRPVLRVIAGLVIAGLLAAIAIHPFPVQTEPGKFELSALDVGQGDSLLAAFPGGKLMLIDAGGVPSFGRARRSNIDIGEDVVAPYLWTRSIRHLDVVVMTHAHTDHMGGMPAILRDFHPTELWTGAVAESEEWRQVRAAALRYGVRIREMRRREPFTFDRTKISVLAPAEDYIPDIKPRNDDSLVMRIDFGATAFLLAGDMEKSTESSLVSEGRLDPVTVLKVGHHGSRTSSTAPFLDLLHPSFALISDGFENTYGHPHPATLDALLQRHVQTLRTDKTGLLRVLSDGHRIRLN